MNKYVAMFLCSLIRLERWRFNYGYNLSLTRNNELKIKLPVDENGEPDWEFMEEYVKSLPYSSSIPDPEVLDDE